MLIQFYITFAFSILGYFITVIFIVLNRYKNKIKNLSDRVNFIGASGIVEQPFSKYNCGKIKVKIKDSWQSIVAITNEDRQFLLGDRILIFGMIEEGAIVICDRYF